MHRYARYRLCRFHPFWYKARSGKTQEQLRAQTRWGGEAELTNTKNDRMCADSHGVSCENGWEKRLTSLATPNWRNAAKPKDRAFRPSLSKRTWRVLPSNVTDVLWLETHLFKTYRHRNTKKNNHELKLKIEIDFQLHQSRIGSASVRIGTTWHYLALLSTTWHTIFLGSNSHMILCVKHVRIAPLCTWLLPRLNLLPRQNLPTATPKPTYCHG